MNKHGSIFVVAVLLVATLLTTLPAAGQDGAAGQGAVAPPAPQPAHPLYPSFVGATEAAPSIPAAAFVTATDTPKRVGIQIGHAPDDPGSMCKKDGTKEVTVNEAVANKAAELLRAFGFEVDVFLSDAKYTHNYVGDVFIALHSDQCAVAYSGYKISRWHGQAGTGLDGSGDASDRWVQTLWDAYGAATSLPRDTLTGHFAPCMREYYALNPEEGGRVCTGKPEADAENWTQVHGIADTTPGAIIELGWLSGDHDFLFSTAGQLKMATGIQDAVVKFLGAATSVTDIPNPDAYQCSQSGHVDFEGFSNGTDLTSGTISGLQFMTTGGFTWVVGDWATGSYNGKYPNGGYTSVGTHWAWLGPSQGAGLITFPKGPASYFSLLVSADTSVSLDAYDVDGNKLATAGPAPTNYNTGHIVELKIVRTTADIDHVIVHDSGNYFLVDEVCTNAAWTPNTIKRVADQTYPMQTGQSVLGSFFADLFNGFKTFLHIFVGPFGSDVDLRLTRPDGSQVQPGDPDVTIDKTSAYVDVSIVDAAPGEWKYEIVANALEPAGENIRIRVDEQAFEVPNVAPELVAPDGQDALVVQNSDALEFGIAASDANDGGKLRFFAADLPDGLSLVDNADGTAAVTGTLSATPGTYNATIMVTDPKGATDTMPFALVVTPEDARTDYAGARYASTASTGSTAARVTLAATVLDITAVDPAGDPNPGDIRTATLTFVDRATGSALCTAPLALVSPSDPKVAAGTCSWDVEIAGDSQSFTIGTVVGGAYARNAAADNTIVTVAKPPAGTIIAGGGYLLLAGSGGEQAGDDGTKHDFGFGVKYGPGEQNPQGNFVALIRRTETGGIQHTYQVKVDAIASAAVDPARRSAVFRGKANIVDITDPRAPVTVEGSASLQVNVTDRSQSGAAGSIAITVWNSAGGLWFASKWDGAQAVEAPLGGGSLTVRSQSLLFVPALRRAEP